MSLKDWAEKISISLEIHIPGRTISTYSKLTLFISGDSKYKCPNPKVFKERAHVKKIRNIYMKH